jgi:hypothetical protein
MAENEMDILVSSIGQDIILAGEKLTIKPYSWANTIKMARPLAVVMNALFLNYKALGQLLDDITPEEENVKVKKEKKSETTRKKVNGDNVFHKCMKLSDFISTLQNADELIDAIAEMMSMAVGKEKAFVIALLPDDAFTLGHTIYEVNKAFFTKRLGPMLMEMEKTEEKQEK